MAIRLEDSRRSLVLDYREVEPTFKSKCHRGAPAPRFVFILRVSGLAGPWALIGS